MLNWYDGMYVGEGMSRRKLRKTVADLNAGRPVAGKFLITLAANPADQLEIIDTANLMKKTVYERTPTVVGIAGNYDEAVQLVIRMAEETLKETGDADIRRYLKEK